MKDSVKIFFTILVLTLVYSPLMSQSSISGIVNSYTSIDSLLFREGSDVANAVLVNSTVGFSIDDTVMVYQPKGFVVDRDDTKEGWISDEDFLRHVGKYTLLIIDDIILDTIVFNNSTGFDFAGQSFRKYGAGEVGQLIKVASYENAVVTGTLKADPWDPVSNTGGVVVLYVKGKLTLNAPIDVSGQGFLGANPGVDEYGLGKCYSLDPTGLDDFFYTSAAMDSAGLKGGGAADTTFRFVRGKGSLINGGGGGNARYSGGGGGSNYSAGGDGGGESEICALAEPSVTKGKSGYAFASEGLYANDTGDELYSNRIFMGGGGGSGTQDPGFPASKGGNGGGIVIIIADTLEGSLATPILAKGQSVTDIVSGSGGGGGGGGAIILDVSHYEGDVHIDASGGDGGNTIGTDYFGPGGGGGGGVYWMRFDSLNVDKGIGFGAQGKYDNQTSGQAGAGNISGLITNLKVPLDGFLFNTVPGDKTVCSDETPDPINATAPKGGDNNYVFEWSFKPDTASKWYPDTITREDYYFYEPLTMTTMYKRKVISGSLSAYDSLTYTVLQKIEGNYVLASDTVCFGLEAIPFNQHPDSIRGGALFDSDFTYNWIKSTDGGTLWSDATGTRDTAGYVPPGLDETTIYSRVIESGVCDDTSNFVIVTVLPEIGGNVIFDIDTVCFNQQPDTLKALPLTGGDGDYLYQWIQSGSANGSYNNANSFNPDSSINATFFSDTLESTTYFKRVVYSGMDVGDLEFNNMCIDSSDAIEIIVLPSITNNDITTADTSICEDISLTLGIEASTPLDGEEGVYRYEWLQSSDAVLWSTASGTFNLKDYDPGVFSDTTYYRRRAMSGKDNACQDTSDFKVVNVLLNITNNFIISTSDRICQDIDIDSLQASNTTLLGGGDNSFDFEWERSSTGLHGEDNWTGLGLNVDPVPDTLETTTYFHRKVYSPAGKETCVSYTDSILIDVENRIEYDTIWHIPGYVCDSTELSIDGESNLIGGDGSYTYLWEDSDDGVSFGPIDTVLYSSVDTLNNYEEEAYQIQRYFRRVVNSGECSHISDTLTIPVVGIPSGSISRFDASDIYCAGDPVSLQVSIAGGLSPYTIGIDYSPYDVGNPLDDETDQLAGALISHSPTSTGQTDYTYTLRSIEDENGCFAIKLDSTVVITVYRSPVAKIMGDSIFQVCGDSILLQTEFSEDFYVKDWHWSILNIPENASSVNIENPTTGETYALLNRDTTDLVEVAFEWLLKDPGGVGCESMDRKIVKFYERPWLSSIKLKIDYDSVFVKDEYDLNSQINPLNAGFAIWENIGSIGSFDDDTTANIDVPFYNNESQDYLFEYIVEAGECGPYSDVLSITRLGLELYDGFSPDFDAGNKNNAFAARGLENALRFSCYIYNSWGTLIKTVNQEDLKALDEETGEKILGTVTDDFGEAVQVLWKGSKKDQEIDIVPEDIVDEGIYYYVIKVWMTDLEDEDAYEESGYIILRK